MTAANQMDDTVYKQYIGNTLNGSSTTGGGYPWPNNVGTGTGGWTTWPYQQIVEPTPPHIPLNEQDKMELIKLLGELQDKEVLKKKMQELIDEMIEKKGVTLSGDKFLIILHALLQLLKQAEAKA